MQMSTAISENPMFPILCIDIVGFTSQYKDDIHRKAISRQFQELIEQAGSFISTVIPFSKLFEREKTGDGYYILLKTISTMDALEYTQHLRQEVTRYNLEEKGKDLPLSLRLVLAYGTVELVGDQYYSSVMADANRLIDDKNFKQFMNESKEPSALFSTMLFHHKLKEEFDQPNGYSHLRELKWSRLPVEDKHGQEHIGYIQGDYIPTASQSRRVKSKAAKRKDGENKLLRNYLEVVNREHSRISLFGFLSSANIPVNLLDAFVSLRLTESGRDFPEIRVEKETNNRLVSPRQLLVRAITEDKSILILGEPGSGKTTLMRYLAICSIDDSKREQLSLKKPLIPLLIPLREIDPQQPFVNSLAVWAINRNLELSKDILKDWLHEPGLLVLLDGLDEVSSLENRKSVCRWIDNAATAYGESIFVVTCRFTGYSQADGIFLNRSHIQAEVHDLDENQQKDFLIHWFTASALEEVHAEKLNNSTVKKNELEIQATIHADDIMNFLGKDENQSFRDMAGIPVLLQIMAIIWREQGSLSGSRVSLYDRSINYLLDHRDRKKHIEPLVNAAEAREILRYLSLWMQSKLKKDELPGNKIEEYITGMLEEINPKITPTEFLNYMRDRAGVLVKSNDSYMFQHKSFREYLAAVEIANRGLADLLVENFNDDWWRETILFSAGLTEPAVFSEFLTEFLIDDHNGGATLPLLLQMVQESVRLPIAPIIAVLTDHRYSWRKRYNTLQCLRNHPSERVITAVKSISNDKETLLRNLTSELLAEWNVDVPSKKAGKQASIVSSVTDKTNYIFISGGSYQFPVTKKKVSVSNLYVAKYPVMNKHYRQFIASLSSNEVKKYMSDYLDDRRFGGDEQPVVGVNWYGAMAYCHWLTETWPMDHFDNPNARFSLPTEVEWEWIAGNGNRKYPWGPETPDKTRANFGSKVGQTTPVGSYPEGATPEGVMNMAGNVWEWCMNRRDDPEFQLADRTNLSDIAIKRKDSDWTVLRGGAWNYGPDSCSCSARIAYDPGGRWQPPRFSGCFARRLVLPFFLLIFLPFSVARSAEKKF